MMRLFHLLRTDDASGVSGTGVVAEGVEFSDGRVAMCWMTEPGSVAVYDSIRDVRRIHGHGGKSVVMLSMWRTEGADDRGDDQDRRR